MAIRLFKQLTASKISPRITPTSSESAMLREFVQIGARWAHYSLQAYKSLVRPILEYSSSFWDHYVNNQIQAIEKVQRRAVRFASNFKEREPGCMTAHMKRLEIPTLQDRRNKFV